MFAGQAAIVTCVLADGDAGATVIIRCALTMRLRSRDFAVPMDAKECEVMAVCSASVDDGARNPFRASTARRDQLRLAAEVIARSRCVSVLSRSHQPVGDCRGTPSPNAKLVLVAFRTRLIAMKNIRSRSASGGDMDPYSSAAHDQCKIGSLLSNASTKGLSRGSVCRRGSAERKSESRAVVAERKDTCRWRARALARAKLDFTSSRRSVDSTSTNRQGWQYPTE